MMNFQYFVPTKIITGQGCVVEQAAAMKGFGAKALIVTGARSARANGSLDDAIKALKANGQPYAVFDKVMSNPTVQCAYDGAAAARENGCDFLVAIGGGSPMDAAKAMALLAAQKTAIPREKIFSTVYAEALPVVAVPPTAGTGSEVTQYAVLTNDAAETKTPIATPLIFPALACLDPAYMKSLGKTVTVNTAVDALSHAMEGMLSIRASKLSDTLAKESLALIASCFDDIQKDNVSMDAREKLLLASTMAGMVMANAGTTAVHALGYSLTYYKGIDHGRANGLLLPRFLAFVETGKKERVAEILACMNMRSVGEFAALMDALLGKRETLDEREALLYAEKASKTANTANCLIRPEKDDLLGILRACM
jgi:alcohol dehydrogenase class IV